MKRSLLVLWLLLPVLLVAIHLRYGRSGLERDRIQSVIHQAQANGKNGDWAKSAALLDEAAESLRTKYPSMAFRLDLAKGLALARAGDARKSSDTLQRMFSNPTLASMPPAFHRELHEASGRLHYNIAWLQRLDGAPRKDWMTQSDRARRHFRLLAESRMGNATKRFTEGQRRNLEAAVRLQRMGLEELKGLPPPSLLPGGSGSGQPSPNPNAGDDGQDGARPGEGQPGGMGDSDVEEGTLGNRGKRAAPPAEGKGS